MSNTEQVLTHLEQALIAAVSKVLGIDQHRVHANESLSHYGFDSITLTQLANQLNERFDFIRLDASTFLEHTSIAALHKHLCNRYADELAGLFEVAAEAPTDVTVPAKIILDETPKVQSTASSFDGEAVSGSSLLDDFEFSELTEHSESPPIQTHDVAMTSKQSEPVEGADDIAIIGVAGQFPGADNIIELWENLYREKNALTKIPNDRWDWEAIYGDPESEDNLTDCCYGGFIKDLERFDPLFFGISPLEASQMDPQQKLVLQSTWETLENAGYSIDQLRGEDVGVFLGVQRNENLFNLMKAGEDFGPYTNIGNTHSMLANRVSYFFDWKGNSLSVDTACSASSSALHLAYHALRRGEIRYALVGGVTVVQDSFSHIANRKMGLLTNKPRVRSFDKDSDGYLIGEGVATVMLKPANQAEKDGDYIYGVIKSCSVNQGGKTLFLTAPDPAAHVKVIRSALKDAGLKPDDIDYIEGQGTGTTLSDKAELKAYAEVFASNSEKNLKLGVGSIKGNIGHVESASGITALIKVCLSMKNGLIPPVLNFSELNWDQAAEAPPFEVVGQQRLWLRKMGEEHIHIPRRAGVHNFGYGGLSAHFVVEEHDNTCEASMAGNVANTLSNDELLLFSSKSQKQLDDYLAKLLRYLVNDEYQYFGIQQLRLADVAHTLQVGREDMPCRVAMIVASVEELVACLKQYLAGVTSVTGLLRGSVDTNTDHRFSREQISPMLYQNQSWRDIAERWIKGASRSQWLTQIWSGELPSRGSRIPLPGYCFDFMTSSVEREVKSFPLAEPQANPVAWLQYSTAFQRLEVLAREGLFSGFQSWGACQTLDEILDPKQLENALGIAQQHRRLFKVLLNILVRANVLEAVGNNYRVVRVVSASTEQLEEQVHQLIRDFPELETQVSLTWDCLQNLRAVLRDEMPATQILFPDASMQRVEGFYKGNPIIDYFNKQVSWHVLTAVHEMSQKLPANAREKIRILEIGAGTGGITAGILRSIRGSAEHLHYVYSDISPGFTQFGQRTFEADFPFLAFQVLDIEKDLSEQGFSEHSFDLIVASNVLHATVNMQRTLGNTQRLLKPTGRLILNEVTDASDHISLTFGLLKGWWAFEDDAQRLPGGPLLNSAMWTDLLQQQGFATVDVFGNIGPDSKDSGYNVVVASLKERTAPAHGDVAARSSNDTVDASEKISVLTPNAPAHSYASISSTPTLSQVSEVFARVLMIDVNEIRVSEPYVNYGVDSFTSLKIVKAINDALGVQLRSTELFNFPDITALSHHIQQLPSTAGIAQETVTKPMDSNVTHNTPAATSIEVSATPSTTAATNKNARIAVIGMSGRFPQAADTGEFWENLAAGKDSIQKTPAHRWNGEQFWGGFVDDIDSFDPLFFNISPKEAEWMNPQQRLFIQEAWRTFEHAGYSSDAVKGSRCGVFAGCQESDYLQAFDELELNGYQGIGNSAAILSARIAYFLDLKGPSLSIDTACSSSLVAVHLACESIRSGTCDMALAGGVSILCTDESHRVLSKSGMLSPEGRCKTFDDSANGFVPAEAVGVVLLKSLDQALLDGDHVLGVIQAHGINQDGKTNGITASSSPSQFALQTETYQRFGINPERISYVEAHGTGTSLGDPIEVDALDDTFRGQTSSQQFCAIGSVKTNIGHTLAAAGVVGLIKVLLSLQHKQIPASLHFEKENQHFQLEKTAFYVNTALQVWESPMGVPRQAAINSFGFSGTNAHCVVEEAPAFTGTTNVANTAPYLIPLSAKTVVDLSDSVQLLAEWLEQGDGSYQINDVAATLLLGRTHFDYRIALVVEDWQELVTVLKEVMQQPESYLFKVKPKQDHSTALQYFGQQLLLGINDKTGHLLPSSGYRETLLSLADLYQQGYPLEWQRIYQNDPGSAAVFRKVPLPTYPFNGQRYWLAPVTSAVDHMVVVEDTQKPSVFNFSPTGFPDQSSELRAFQEAYATLSPLCAVLLSSTLQSMGAFTTVGAHYSLTELSNLLQLESKYACLLDAFMSILLEAGHVRRQGTDYVRIDDNPQAWQLPFDQVAKETQNLADKYPRIKAFVNLLAVCVQNCPEVLQGKLNATEVMFPGSSFDLVKGIYKENATADFYNQILVNNVIEHIRQKIADTVTPTTLNILEIGAGTGGTSALLLKALKQHGFGEHISYLYTDISSGFVQYGRRTYGVDHPFARFEMLDIEKIIPSDCTYRQTFDIVVAANVIHATRDLDKTMDHVKALMKQEGYLFLNEATDVQPFATMTYGLLDGWWLFEDDLRLENSPLLDAEKWVEFLQSKEFMVAPPQGLEGDRKGPGQHILIAKHHAVNPGKTDTYTVADIPATVDSSRQQKTTTPNIVAAPLVLANSEIASLDNIKRQVQQEVMSAISFILGLQDDDLLLEKQFSDYGLDSISGIDFLNRINERLAIDVRVTALFDYPSVRELSVFIYDSYQEQLLHTIGQEFVQEQESPLTPSGKLPDESCITPAVSTDSASTSKVEIAPSNGETQTVSSDLAIIGMSGRFAGAKDAHEFWDNLAAGVCSIDNPPSDRWPEESVAANYQAGFLQGIDQFDPLFFNWSGSESEQADPQQRIFLEEAYTALEDAGYPPKLLKELKCGVFAGVGMSDYLMNMREQGYTGEAQTFWGNSPAVVPARISYFLNLKGPSISIDTACSASLVAMHTARQSILAGECDMALAGGVFLYTTPHFHTLAQKAQMLAPDGKCKAFDQNADGFVFGEGAGVVVLKRLDAALRDNDHIHAVVKASGVNQDGKTNGITAPSSLSQSELEIAVYNEAGINPETISYVEAHGTGTKLGDPVEVAALTKAFGKYTDKKQFCHIGSVKTNIGHASLAAGVASVIKVIQSFSHEKIPPLLNFSEVNEHIDFTSSPFLINTELHNWESTQESPRRAAISGFGLSGTNAHLVLEEPPVQLSSQPMEADMPVLICLSAKTALYLQQKIRDLIVYLEGRGQKYSLENIAYSLHVGREHFKHRARWVVRNREQLLSLLQQGGTQIDAGVSTTAEVGPTHLKHLMAQLSTTSLPFAEALEALSTLGDTYHRGEDINWEVMYSSDTRYRVPVPCYPFDRSRFWFPEQPPAASRRKPEQLATATSTPMPTLPPRSPIAGSLTERSVSKTWWQPVWLSTALPISSTQSTGKPLLVFGAVEYDLSFAQGRPVILVVAGSEFALIDSATTRQATLVVQLRPGQLADYQQLVELLAQRDLLPEQILHAWPAHAFALETLTAHLDQGFYSILFIAQTLMQQTGCPERIHLLHAFSPTNTRDYALNQAIGGFARTLNRENPRFFCQTLEIPQDGLLAEVAGMEFQQIVPKEVEVRYEKTTDGELRRSVKTWEESRGWNDHPSEAVALKANGTYLLLGGAGGLGMVFCQYLHQLAEAQSIKIHVVLTGRNPLTSEKVQKIQTMQSRWCEVSYVQADIADSQQINQVIEQAKSNVCGITGIFHFAGSNRDAFLLRKTRMESQEVLAAKVQGTLLLEQALRDENVDFVTFFSSASAAIGNVGQADYAYANSVLDAIAMQGGIAGSRTFSVNWALWEAGGMQLSMQKRDAMTSGMGIIGMTSELGIAAWETVLQSSAQHCLFLAGDDTKIRNFVTKELVVSSPVLQASVPRPSPVNIQGLYSKAEKIGKISTEDEQITYTQAPSMSPRITTMAPKAVGETRETIEQYLKTSMSEVSRLPLDKISTQRSLDEFGLDSLMIMAFNDKLI
ncbi:MAG: SDR family NAD(P)-dependent oxidoreductase, partial [Gammaproteobacteria bacterium]|nr:SDR family NAD(P)-dependent oxidoreductase [Gammaproteobacteria bacterium]